MKITLCGSMKFNDKFLEIQKVLEAAGHEVFMPIAVTGVDYWALDNKARIEAKKTLRLVETHLDKITSSDAILVCNYTKGENKNYIGANTFLEMGYAKYKGKKIFLFNPLPQQAYIADEIESFEAIVLNGDVSLIR